MHWQYKVFKNRDAERGGWWDRGWKHQPAHEHFPGWDWDHPLNVSKSQKLLYINNISILYLKKFTLIKCCTDLQKQIIQT